MKNLILGWGILVPISYLVPKKKNLILFMGRFGGEFLGNVKFLYLYLHTLKKDDVEYYFFTEHKSVYTILKENNLPVLLHPTLPSIYNLLRANIIFASSTAWIKKCKYHLLFRAKKVQLFHGVALKKVELGIPEKAKYNSCLKGRLDNAIRGRFPFYDLVISTSEFFTENIFSRAFNTGAILESGYPRNDIFFKEHDDEYDLLGADKKAMARISNLRAKGYKIILYAPTFRDTGGGAVKEGVLNLDTLSEFAKKYNMILVFKFHISADADHQLAFYENIIEYDNSVDIQPLLKVSDILITDYSSVYMDYLLVDRPIIFFPYDYDKYVQKDRDLAFDYEWITAGPKCYSQQELQNRLKDIIGQKDEFSRKREEIRNIAFKYKDGRACERIWNYIKTRYLNI